MKPENVQVMHWLMKLRSSILSNVRSEEIKTLFNSVILLRHSTQERPDPMLARAEILKLNAGVIPEFPDMKKVRGISNNFSNRFDFEGDWEKIISCRTYRELWTDVRKSVQNTEEVSLPEELKGFNFGSRLEAALKSNRRIIWTTVPIRACPTHHMTIPSSEISKMQRYGVGKTSGCCGKFVILADDQSDE